MCVYVHIYINIKEEVDFKRSSPEREWLGLPAVSSSTKIFLYFFLWLRVKRSLGFLSQMDKPKTPVHMRRWETFWCVLTKEFERDFLAPRQKKNKIKKNNNFLFKKKRGPTPCCLPQSSRSPSSTTTFFLLYYNIPVDFFFLSASSYGPSLSVAPLFIFLTLLWWCEMVIIASPYRLLDISSHFFFLYYISRAPFSSSS
jgi:hypothetical protein